MLKLLLIMLSVFCATSEAQTMQAKTPQPRNDRVVIQPRRIVVVRTPQIAKQFPDRKRAIITYPVISGLSDQVVLRRIRALFDRKNIFDYSLQEYREDAWLSEFSYDVNFNANHLLDITFNQNGVAAYPDDQSKHFLVNLKTGKVVTASEAFDSTKFPELAQRVNEKLQQEIKRIENENKSTGSQDLDEQATVRQAYEVLKFDVENLNDFSVNARGVTFLYDAGFPHVIQALQPAGRYFFTFAELKPFIRADGPLGQFVR